MKMNSRIWSRLPEHLLERVLSFLPLKTLLTLRSTCKHFNSLLSSPLSAFSSRRRPPLASLILLSHPQFSRICPLLNAATSSWNGASLSLPPNLPSSALVSSAGGLLCFSSPSSSCFVVCNPVSRSTRRVMFPICPFHFELATLVPAPDGYKLFVLSGNALVYDSTAESWREYSGYNRMLEDNHHQKGALHNGLLFFATPEPFRVVGFHLETGNWETLRAGLPDELTFVRLASDGASKLYLIGGVGNNGISRSVKVWELGGDVGAWVEFETLPETVCRKFLSICYHNYEHVYCFWQQGCICVCCYTWPEILCYKVCRRTWHWLPKCPSLPEKWSCGFRCFSFVPDLYAAV
ncbi:F-box/kelch-repeat protein [Striga hermonthica]|uniref:F-box/kelch-repeat protein n=1 Tax=Striga hermonthica TaxID=68872 RepID=A0A9N7RU51_STRHE|nr:F-box/kelch-repeat protein [Striga hermonthica]